MNRKLYSSGQSEKLCLTVHLSDIIHKSIPEKKTISHLKSLNTKKKTMVKYI